ncbi:hypothetical protein EDB81DRAFT_934389 [Dactylonectria macrodidyma]|uniref:Heme haloperoxidase family profile domain-containing protein n=1 Tax=Dactylonectria macrodidyma TaxID=307937 RepID=A0A9P9EWA4_9HYPO|nr:hypothetical protein EDB81DRAFT_934389 [Dactylonectria macrodidyma]
MGILRRRFLRPLGGVRVEFQLSWYTYKPTRELTHARTEMSYMKGGGCQEIHPRSLFMHPALTTIVRVNLLRHASMSSPTPAPPSEPLERGKYARSGPDDLRGPCPMINCLANHGYLPRDGRNVHVSDFTSALNEVGLSFALGALLSNPIFLEHKEAGQGSPETEPRSFLGHLWYLACNPWAIAFGEFGMRRPGQVDSKGERVLNLDQFSLHNVVEHDVSLSRLDYGQGDNHSIQKELVEGLLASSSDAKTLTMEDLAALRGRRIEKQKEDNPNLIYESKQHDLACSEIALLLKVLGDGDQVHSDYARAFFHEERLPIAEGWKKRATSIGLLELKQTADKVKKLIGLTF